MTDPSFYQRVAQNTPAPELGASGYFSAPQLQLDPHLFDGEHLKPDVRSHILSTLTHWFEQWQWRDIGSFLHVWIAGSGISYQWAADRGNGDLDVLFGIDIVKFRQANPGFDWPEDQLSAEVNAGMKTGLWPSEAHTNFGGQTYEVTYFWNNGTGKDIRAINPYAAYSVTDDCWVIRPPELPADPRTLYPKAWLDRTDQDAQAARVITDRFDTYLDALVHGNPGTAAWHNSGAALNLIVAQARAMFDDIHTGRRAAFSPEGKGYGDWHNYRWQRAKETGTIQKLHRIVTVAEEARHEEEKVRYGRLIDSAEVVLRRAAQQYQSNRIGR